MTTRRQFLATTVTAAAAVAIRSVPVLSATTAPSKRYPISASDWMLLKRQKLGAPQLAKDCGLDAVEVDMGPLGNRPTIENYFRDDEFLQSYLAKARELDLAISSFAMSCFYGQPFADHPKADEFAAEWIALMPKLGTTHGFLPIITKHNPTTAPAIRANLVMHLKHLAPLAEKAGVTVGLNTQLTAADNNRLLDDVGSPNVKIAYNVGEAVDAKRDPYAELQTLGKDRIAQIIPTLSDGHWLKDDPRVDVPRLKGVLDELNWSGYLVLQRSRMKHKSVRENFSANAAYLNSIFNA